ncbi:hypothetical protein JT358_09270 [Micrococcales bacterium 31B]|nr:hypothetical protein [Micrococcales bacterium 31B]
MHKVVDLVSRDLLITGLPITIGLYHQPTRAWVHGSEVEVSGEFEGDYVLALPGRMHAIGTLADGSPSCIDIMNAVQDWVVDETHRGWPEVRVASGNFLEILTPRLTESGDAMWSGKSISIPLGSLDKWDSQIH